MNYLNSVNDITKELLANVRRSGNRRQALSQITDGSGVSKGALLERIPQALQKAGLLPLVISPPRHSPDTAPAVLVEVGVGLKRHGVINGDLMSLKDPSTPWNQKLDRVGRWVESAKKRIVLICDEPLNWPSGEMEDTLFRDHSIEVVKFLLWGSFRRVILGDVPPLLRPLDAYGYRVTDPIREFVSQVEGLSIKPEAKWLAEELIRKGSTVTPLQFRLLISIAALDRSWLDIDWFERPPASIDLVDTIAHMMEKKQDLAGVRKLWATLSLVRRPFSKDLLTDLGFDLISPLAREVFEICLLTTAPEGYELPGVLKLDERRFRPDRRGLWQGDHVRLADYYTRVFQKLESNEDAGYMLLEMEAFHHATSSADSNLLNRLSPFFVDQLDAYGRAVSLAGNRGLAVKIFEKAVCWDPNDDYAHHYWAYNLDYDGIKPVEVEEHYQRAIDLKSSRPLWWSRWITFLITRGRAAEARAAWGRAVEALKLTSVRDNLWMYQDLHKWVARLLLHRALLDFAEDVLHNVPDELLIQDAGFRALERRLIALREENEHGMVFPMWIRPEEWWEGPHLAPRRVDDRSLRLVLPGKVEDIGDEGVRLRVARRSNGQTQYGYLVLTVNEFNSSTQDERVAQLTPGRFLEVAYYGDTVPGTRLIRVYADRTWEDPDIPPFLLDPQRYLKASGFVR